MKEVKDEVTEDVVENLAEENAENTVQETENSETKENVELEDTKIEDTVEAEVPKKTQKSDIENKNKSKKEIVSTSNSENKNASDELISEKSDKKTLKIVLAIIITFVLLGFLLFSTIFALINSNKTTIINGVSVKGIDVSGLSKEQALEKVSSIVNKKLSDDFDLIYNESTKTVIPEQFGAKFDIESSIDTAYNMGRESNIFKNNYEILFAMMFKTNINPSFSYDETFIDTLLAEIQENIPNKLVDPSYSIDGNNLIITKGIDGATIDTNSLKLKIISNLNNVYSENENIEIPVVDSTAKAIDIDKIYSEVHKEPQDAYITKEPFSIYPHVVGVDFGISLAEAKALLKEDKQSYSIPLKFTNPKVTIADLGQEAFPDLLATYSTTYSTRNVNRSTNIRLASEKIDGTVVLPGEVFSYNATVGQRTAAAGFKEAAVYSGGEVTTGIGGGICQVSSTIYNSALLSNLEIVERFNHGFNPGYVPAGRDATVSWGGPDFKFKNTRTYPIRISCSGTGGTITVKIMGLKEENEPEVEIQSWITSYIPYKTIERNDANLAQGETKILENGSSGCRSVCYRIVKQNGKEISKTLLSNDTYSPHNKIVLKGTKAVAPTPTPTPQAPATPQPTTPEPPSSNPETTVITIP